MSYVDAMKLGDTIHVVERRNGKRIFQKKPAKYVFYVKKQGGEYTSIYGDPLVKYETNIHKTFIKESSLVPKEMLFEHDIDPVTRFLETHYINEPAPNLHVAFFDIEVDFDPFRGYSRPDDPFTAVTAVSIHQSWTDKLWCFAIKPPTLSFEEAEKICEKFPNTILCKTEMELFERFFDCIDDADVLSGWNSTTFDIPYMVRRLKFISNKEKTKKFCLWNQYPKERTFEMFGREQITYDLFGRIHMDYLDLYKKNTYHEMSSYKLDNVGEYEVKEKKIVYEGSLDKLYKEDFELFIKYNRQDTALLKKIDDKLKFIELSNQLAHDNTVTIAKTLGSVALIEQAINIEVHRKNLICPSKKHSSNEETSVAGAYVVNPKKGMHEWVGSIDINSLYPSVIRSLNMSPETIVGQLRIDKTKELIHNYMKNVKNATLTDAWALFFGVEEYDMIMSRHKKSYNNVTCNEEDVTSVEEYDMVVAKHNHSYNSAGDTGSKWRPKVDYSSMSEHDLQISADLEDGDTLTMSAQEWYDTIFNSDSNLSISANGTLFRTDVEGIIPGLLTRWYAERVELKSKAGELKAKFQKMEEEKQDPVEINKVKEEYAFYDKRQLIKKILLNSLYGALLNAHCRYFDQRLGQSTTLTGRCITKHMSSKANELFTGEYNHVGKAIVYGDTDSAYFSAYTSIGDQIEWNKENVQILYDSVCDAVNESFPTFMMDTFHTTKEGGEVIQAGREALALRGIFLKKKRYSLLCYDIEGRRFDTDGKPGKIKAMGVEIKRSDTPKKIQDFLENVLMKVLSGGTEDDAFEMIQSFRNEFRDWPGYFKGTPKGVNGLTKKVELEKKLGKVNMPGHVRASWNWNKLKKMNNDYYSMEITDGAKVVVCKLKDNPLGYTSIAYPVDEEHLPDWFKDLPFDDKAMEEGLIDQKLKNLFGVLDWDLKRPEADTTFGDLFSLS